MKHSLWWGWQAELWTTVHQVMLECFPKVLWDLALTAVVELCLLFYHFRLYFRSDWIVHYTYYFWHIEYEGKGLYPSILFNMLVFCMQDYRTYFYKGLFCPLQPGVLPVQTSLQWELDLVWPDIWYVELNWDGIIFIVTYLVWGVELSRDGITVIVIYLIYDMQVCLAVLIMQYP